MRYVDLYSGIGGFHLGVSKFGYECVGYSEVDKKAIETWVENFGIDMPALGDINQIDKLPENLDLVTGGVPCQPWSVAGDGKGFNDERGQLWFKTIDLIKKARPKHFILENVKGLTFKCHKESLNHILNEFKNSGYYVYHKVLDSCYFGLPQERQRLFIVGSLVNDNFKFPVGSKNTKPLSDFLPGLVNLPMMREKFYLSDLRNSSNYIHSWEINNIPHYYQILANTILPLVKEGKKDNVAFDLSKMKLKMPNLTQEDLDKLCEYNVLKKKEGLYRLKHNSNNYGFQGFSRIVFPHSTTFPTLTKTGVSAVVALSSETADNKARTIKEVILGKEYRKITANDSRILQGFPDSFICNSSEREAVGQFGNAVSVPLIEAIVSSL